MPTHVKCHLSDILNGIHTLRVHYLHAAANLNLQYSKYAKVACMHYFVQLHSEHITCA